MKNDIIIKKIVGYIDKIQGYCDGKDYEGVNLRLVWEIIDGDLQELKEQLQTI